MIKNGMILSGTHCICMHMHIYVCVIVQVLDCLERDELGEWDEDERSVVSFTTHTTIDDHPGSLVDEVDVMIRVAFVDFLFSPEILGCTEQYMCIYRLFTRPVVSIKTTAFIHGYQKNCPATNTKFIKNLIRSQVGLVAQEEVFL